ncbi:tetratricopeptide repeat protein [Mycoplasma zalophi]|uniref:tetratricopeptide repeat protein n=1 Tax=Mycoplasma zalophi TaxID=191287 RepID=UPI001C10AB01|nr:hypothetical protein [Mycoplasma zalophi]MBU4690883.1 hypothetical protein [Mycoplasma zalophi]
MNQQFDKNNLEQIKKTIQEYETKKQFDRLFAYFETLEKEYKHNLQLVVLMVRICLNNNYPERARKYSEPLVNLVPENNRSYNELMCAVYDRNYEFYNAKYFLLRLLKDYPDDKFYLTQLSLYNSFTSYFNVRHSFITYIYEISKILLNEIKIYKKELENKNTNQKYKHLNFTINTIPDLEVLLINDNNQIIPKITFNFEIGELILLTYLAKSFLRNHHIDMIISTNPYAIPTIVNKQTTDEILKKILINIDKKDYINGHKIIIYHSLNNEDELAYLETISLYLKLCGNYQSIIKIYDENLKKTDKLLSLQNFLIWSFNDSKNNQIIHDWKDISIEILDFNYTKKHIFSNFIKTYKTSDQYFYFDLLYRNGLIVLNLDFETNDVEKTKNNFIKWVNEYSKETYQILDIKTDKNHLNAEVLMFDARNDSLSMLNNSFCAQNDEINTLKVNLYNNSSNKEIIYSKQSEFKDLSILFDYPLPEICNNQTINTFKAIAEEKAKYLKNNVDTKLADYYLKYRMMKIDSWIELNKDETEEN